MTRHESEERLPPPPWLTSAGPLAREEMRLRSGEQAEWGYAIPAVVRWVNGGQHTEPLPRPPARDEDHDAALAYWAALLHVLLYSLGWSAPERGVRWWVEHGRPNDDARLALLGRYERDGMLDWFLAWLERQPLDEQRHLLEEVTGASPPQRERHDRQWLADREREADASGVHNPLTGGSDPLHLAAHCTGPLEAPAGEVTFVHSDAASRRASLIVDSMPGWYRVLAEHGRTLPDLGNRSWHVEVTVRSTGYLGTYRRSRETGLWFAGGHRHHTPGAV